MSKVIATSFVCLAITLLFAAEPAPKTLTPGENLVIDGVPPVSADLVEQIGRYTALPRRQPAYRQGRAHEDFVTNLDLPRDRLVEAIRTAWLPLGSPTRSAALPEARVEQLVTSKLADPEWIERL